MSHLTPAQLSELKKQLQEKLEKLSEYKESVAQESPALDPDRSTSNEAGEESLEAYELLATEALEGESQKILQDIRDALTKMEQGKYGIDENTGEPIPFARLKLFPEARTNA